MSQAATNLFVMALVGSAVLALIGAGASGRRFAELFGEWFFGLALVAGLILIFI